MNVKKALEHYGWDGKFFLLTRVHAVEITTVGGGYGDVPVAEKGCLFHYANQVMGYYPSEEIDEFGRGYLDQLFIALCARIHCFIYPSEPRKAFKLLTARKEGDKYMVRVKYDDEDVELGVVEMFNYFSKKVEEAA